jgi:hypothetical protein
MNGKTHIISVAVTDQLLYQLRLFRTACRGGEQLSCNSSTADAPACFPDLSDSHWCQEQTTLCEAVRIPSRTLPRSKSFAELSSFRSPVSPFSPNSTSATFASVPAPRTSDVVTATLNVTLPAAWVLLLLPGAPAALISVRALLPLIQSLKGNWKRCWATEGGQ